MHLLLLQVGQYLDFFCFHKEFLSLLEAFLVEVLLVLMQPTHFLICDETSSPLVIVHFFNKFDVSLIEIFGRFGSALDATYRARSLKVLPTRIHTVSISYRSLPRLGYSNQVLS